jgi:hypothetical protein
MRRKLALAAMVSIALTGACQAIFGIDAFELTDGGDGGGPLPEGDGSGSGDDGAMGDVTAPALDAPADTHDDGDADAADADADADAHDGDHPDGGPPGDAASDGDAKGDGAADGAIDGPTDAAGDSDATPCTLTALDNDDVFATMKNWVAAGAATIGGPRAQWSQITPGTAGSAGGVFWNGVYDLRQFDLTATFELDQSSTLPTGEYGIAFVWVPGAMYKVGPANPNLGTDSLGAYAVGIRTSSPSKVVVLDPNGTIVERSGIPVVNDGKPHTLHVTYDGTQVIVSIDNNEYLRTTITGFPLVSSGHWGFTGATSNLPQSQFVTAVTMKICQ